MTYLFDLGNVLLAFDFIPALNSLKGENPEPDALEQIIQKKDAFESGKISLPDFITFLRKVLDYKGDDKDIITAWNSIFTKIPQTFELAKSLKKEGHRLIIFSNINPIHAPFCVKEFGLLEIFDHAVFSYEIGEIKPYDNFFVRAFDKFQIIAEDTIYIDDLPDNIAAGKRHGLLSFCYDYEKHNDLVTWLKDPKN